MSVFNKILKAGEGKRVRELASLVGPINELGDAMAALSDEELRAKTDEFRARLNDGETLDDLLIEAFAVVREGATCLVNVTTTNNSWVEWHCTSAGLQK